MGKVLGREKRKEMKRKRKRKEKKRKEKKRKTTAICAANMQKRVTCVAQLMLAVAAPSEELSVFLKLNVHKLSHARALSG